MLFLNIFFGTLFFLYGIIIGSFLNVCIYRIPLKETVVTTPSHCMSCGHKLAWYDLFPLFSYLFLGGKCRYCKAKISFQYPLVESLNGVLYLLTYLILGVGNIKQTLFTFCVCLMISALIVLSGIDIKYQLLPDAVNLVVFLLGAVVFAMDLPFFGKPVYINWYEHLIGMFVVSVPLFILQLFGMMGGGDTKLYFAAGLFIGFKAILLSIVVAALVGAAFSILYMAVKRIKFGSKTYIPFGPFIAISIPVVLFWGDALVDWYVSNFLNFG